MATSWNIPALVNKIASDIPGLNTLLKALLKWDTSGTANIPTGAKRMANVTGGKQLQQYDGASWGSTGKLMHDVDMLDGFHASQSQTAGTIPVRNANGAVPGNITGNAATATEASALANDYVVPVANGGTGANTEAGARQALGTNNAGNITTGVLATARGGTGRTDGMVTDVMLADYNVSATSVGQLGKAAQKNAVGADTLIVPGIYYCSGCTVELNWPTSGSYILHVRRYNNVVHQVAYGIGISQYKRVSTDTGASWSKWHGDYFGDGNITIYVAKNGSDTNTGITADSPLLTVEKALQQASAIGNSGTVIFRFGAGEWGTVTISGDGMTSGYVAVLPFTDGYSATDPGNSKPKFDSLSLTNGQFQISNIEVKYLHSRDAFVYVRYYNKISRVGSTSGTYIRFEGGTLDVKVDSSISVGGVFSVQDGGHIYVNEPVALESGLTYPCFVNSAQSSGFFHIGNSFSCTGTYTGIKFNVNEFAHLSFFYRAASNTVNSLPGTGSTIYGGVSYNGIPAKSTVATKLETSRTIRTNLASTIATSFDGSENVTPGVDGVLPIANGGTGSSTKNFVDLDSAQTVGGVKTFTSTIKASIATTNNNVSYSECKDTALDISTAPSNTRYRALAQVVDINNRPAHTLQGSSGTDGSVSTYLTARRWLNNALSIAQLTVGVDNNGSKWASCPTPPANANDGKIATTEWVRTAMNNQNLTGNITTSGRVTATSGLSTSGNLDITGNVVITAAYKGIITKSTRIPTKASGDAPSVDAYAYLWKYGGLDVVEADNSGTCVDILGAMFPDFSTRGIIRVFNRSNGDFAHLTVINESNEHTTITNAHLHSGTSNVYSLGRPSRLWSVVYAANGSIQTSDERKKEEIGRIPDEVLDAWEDVNFRQFKYDWAKEEKGDNARLHSGLIAQEIDRIFTAKGLDASQYGLYCYDKWDAKDAVKDENGTVIEEALEAGDAYAIRYEEALCMEAAYQRRRADRLEERVARLEELVARLMK